MQTPSFDVAVIGGGPAGMMAAGRAAELGAKVILLEKNPSLGKKLLITGGGRCNIFHAEFDTHALVEKYGKKGKALFSTFSQFDVEATQHFFESRGLPTKIEAEKRAFPVSDRAEDVHRTMLQYLEKGKVTVRCSSRVKGLQAKEGRITKVLLENGEVTARNVVLATGGTSHPETGSTGDGFTWMKSLGHTVIQPDPALVPVALTDTWIRKMAGISLTSVKLTTFQGGEKKDMRTGKMLFTHEGISGPLVLNMSKTIGSLLHAGPVTLSLDLFPLRDLGSLDQFLQKVFDSGKNKMIKNHLGEIVQPRLGLALLSLAEIDPDTPLRILPREKRLAFARILKDIPLHVSHLLGKDKAVVTGGGVSLKEVVFSSMQSTLFPNLFLAGDILDFDRPSGGFSLQICWTTGFVAGTNASTSP